MNRRWQFMDENSGGEEEIVMEKSKEGEREKKKS